jgi:hypothetical protein
MHLVAWTLSQLLVSPSKDTEETELESSFLEADDEQMLSVWRGGTDEESSEAVSGNMDGVLKMSRFSKSLSSSTWISPKSTTARGLLGLQ